MKGCSHTVAWCFHTKGDWNGFVGMEMRVFGICIELGNIYTGIDCEVICAKKYTFHARPLQVAFVRGEGLLSDALSTSLKSVDQQ